MIEYPMPGQAPDLFKGFREELANIERIEQAEQQKALKMASMIEQADKSTMFGGDYAEAQQMAQWMTDHIDDFADSTEGMIEFQQMAQQLNSFIDASEAYKRQNVGTAAGGSQQGSWMGAVQRAASGIDPYEDKGFRDTRTQRDYEMTYMSLNQQRSLQFDEQGRPVLSQRGRIENPFMPQLEELPFEGGFAWMEKNAKGHSFPDGRKDVEAWLERKAADPKLRTKIVRDWAKRNNNTDSIEDLLADETFVSAALEDFYNSALESFDIHAADPKPEKIDEDETLLGRFEKLTIGEFTTEDMPLESVDPTEGIPPLGPGIPTMEMPQPGIGTGFDAFYELRKPISSLSLGEDKKVMGFNVDAFGNLYVVVKQPAQASDDPNKTLDEEPGMELVTMKVEVDSMLDRTLKRYIDRDIRQALMEMAKRRVQATPTEEEPQAASAEKGGIFSRFFGLR